MTSPHKLTVAIVAGAVAFAAASVLALAAVAGAFDHGRSWQTGSSCVVPALPGTVVDATLINMGGPMTRDSKGSMMGGMMRLSLDRSTVAAGQVTFLAVNAGNINHELVVLPLPTDQIVGTRSIGADGKIDEAGSLGEASKSCAAGSGSGIAPGASSWVTVTLPAGRYEVVCNLAGHYASGMYAQLVVS